MCYAYFTTIKILIYGFFKRQKRKIRVTALVYLDMPKGNISHKIASSNAFYYRILMPTKNKHIFYH